VVDRLADVPGVGRVLAIDAAELPAPWPGVETRVMDHRDRLLPLALDGVDVLVHCAFVDDIATSPDSLYGANVGAPATSWRPRPRRGSATWWSCPRRWPTARTPTTPSR
jgi:hypothetical protein